MDRLPLELLELLLLRTFVKLFTDHYKSQFNARRVSVQRSYSALAAVCYNWWQTMNGWPQSPTGHWFRHQLYKHIKYLCRPFSFHPRLQHRLTTLLGVGGVAQNDGKLFAICQDSNTILVFGRNFEQLTSIVVKDMKRPNDLVACTETGMLFIVDLSPESRCVWRVAVSGDEIVRWFPTPECRPRFLNWIPWSLSITSRRLLVTSTTDIVQFDETGVEMNRIPFPYVEENGRLRSQLQHAVETSHMTFVVIRLENKPRISEVDINGRELRSYSDQQRLVRPWYLALDSNGRIFVADDRNGCVLLLNHRLRLERILEYEKIHQLIEIPTCMCYVERTGQLMIAGGSSDSTFIAIFKVS